MKTRNTPLEAVLKSLPRRTYWFTNEVAHAFNVQPRTIQNICAKKGVAKKVKQGPRGTYVFEIEDIEQLMNLCHRKRGNPNWT